MRDTPTFKFALGQRLVGAIGVVGDQHLVAGFKQRQGDVGNRRQAAGHQHALQATLQRAQPFLQHVGGGRAVQTVGVAGFVFPLAAAHGGDVGEDHRGGLEHARLRRSKALGRGVGVVNQPSGEVLHGLLPEIATKALYAPLLD